MEHFLTENFKTHKWDSARLRHPTSHTRQKFMERIIRNTFPNEEIVRNERNLDLISSNGSRLEIDCYLPNLQLGFEFQEQQHYFHINRGKESLFSTQERDREKRVLCEQKRITLISIPFWWNYNKDSLIATIKQHRSDLLVGIETKADPIDLEVPQHVVDKFSTDIPDLGSVMLSKDAKLSGSFNPAGWYIFEKYDGMRAVWHPKHRQFYSRTGKIFDMPESVKSEMPNFPVDGEIWFGVDSFAEAQKIAKKTPHQKIDWKKFKFMAFDVVDRETNYSARYDKLVKEIPSNHPFIKIAPYTKYISKQQLLDIFTKTVDNGGEGLILRKPDSPYVSGFSTYSYKLRAVKDAPAKLLSKLSNRAWTCVVPKKGELYETTTADLIVSSSYKNPEELKEGDVVLYMYTKFSAQSGGMPTTPKIYKKVPHMTWDEILAMRRNPQAKKVPIINWYLPRSFGSAFSRKAFFDDFARDRGFNPNVDKNWYRITARDIRDASGGSQVITYHNRSHIQALIDLYPNLNLQREKFVGISAYDWTSQENRRESMDSYARETLKIDPLVPENWYSTNYQDFYKLGILTYYDSYISALIDIYPELNLDRNSFSGGKTIWGDENKRRAFFDDYAKQNNFNPKIAQNWLKVNQNDVLKIKGAAAVLGHHNRSLRQAIMDLYPELKLKKEDFEANEWDDVSTQRRFFEELVAKMPNSSLPNSLFTIKASAVYKKPGGYMILNRHKNSLSTALIDLFPEYDLPVSRFRNF